MTFGETPLEPCKWVRDPDGTETMIPGCYGTVISGPHACTCDIPGSRIERAQETIREMHAHLDRLRERLVILRGEHAENLAELRAANAELAVLRRRLGMIEGAAP